MARTRIPRYYGLRIYLSSSILLFFLIFPFFVIVAFQSVPKFISNKDLSDSNALAVADSLGRELDSMGRRLESMADINQEFIDSMVTQAMVMEEIFETGQVPEGTQDSAALGDIVIGSQAAGAEQDDSDFNIGDEGPVAAYFLFFFFGTMGCYLLGLLYNWSFKRYFRLRRKKRNIPEKLHRFCKKQLFRTPVTNSLILILPNLALIVYSLVIIFTPGSFEEEIERNIFIHLFYLTLVVTLLEFLFAYYWQKHRVHLKYIEHIYSEEELRAQVFRRKGGKIRDRFLVASGMTTFLPLMIVVVYMILSLTSLKSLDMESMTREQREVLVGPWAKIFDQNQESVPADRYQNLYYVNAISTVVMMAGIGSGILVSLVYLLLFIRWANKDISIPLKELLVNMRNTRGSETEHYTVVRTNDEIGELAEGYNEMTGKIHQYVENISKMNRELEDKVKQRTEEVVMQKEEIEAQKEEIEAQLDLATLQRDTISRQKELILDSIRYAERIQSAILPPVENLSDYLTDHFILFKPRDIVSGDYYWTTRQGDRIFIAVADCTGHGVPGAFLSMLGISSMNEIVNRNGSIHANQILEQLRDFVITSLHQTGSKGESQDGIEIALCVIDTRKKILEFAGANRPLYLIRYSRKKTGEGAYRLKHIRADRMPIGIYEQEFIPFTNHEIKLQRGDNLYLFSDGYVDQLGGPKRKTFRSKYFRQLLLEIQDQPMEEQKQVLIEKLDSWRGEVEQIDDILVMGIKV